MTARLPVAVECGLSARRTSLGTVLLRVDAIRRATLVQLAAAWCVDDGDLDHRIARLAEDEQHGPVEAADRTVEDIESLADMDVPEVELDRSDALRLYRELGEALGLLPATPRPAGWAGAA